jgi:hypothetical protein
MDIHRHIIYTDIYIHRTYVEYLVLDCVSPFFDGGGGVFSILVWLDRVVTVPTSRETLTGEYLSHRVSRVYISILYVPVVNGLNKV